MRKLSKIFLLSLVIGLASCGTSKYYMTDSEMSTLGYSLDGWSILKNGEVVGVVTTMEWEVYKRNMYKEISIATKFSSDADMIEIARFVHSKFPDSKIEVNEDEGNSFPSGI